MAPPWFKYKVEPMDLANTRQNGVRSLELTCYGCRDQMVINADKFPGELRVRWFGRAAELAGAGSRCLVRLVGTALVRFPAPRLPKTRRAVRHVPSPCGLTNALRIGPYRGQDNGGLPMTFQTMPHGGRNRP
jgi:hypothetical protein